MKQTILILLVLAGCACATVNDEASKQEFVCNNSTTTFTFTFHVTSEDDIDVYTRNDDGTQTQLTKTTDYTVSAGTNEDWSDGGIVTTVSTYDTDITLVIDRKLDQDQDYDGSLNNVQGVTLEERLDRLVLLVQDLQEIVDRCVKTPVSDSSPTVLAQNSVDRASKFPYWDPNGNLTSATTTDAILSSFASSLVDDTTAAEAQKTLGLWRSSVNMVYTDSETWVVYNEDGDEINISGTTTNGLQEAIDYCTTNNMALHIHGSDVMQIRSTITIDARQNNMDLCWYGGGVLNYTSGIGTEPGIVINSSYKGNDRFNCTIAYRGSGSAVVFKPEDPVPTDRVTSIWTYEFYAHEIYCPDGNAYAVEFDTTDGAISNANHFRFQLIDAGNAFKWTGSNGFSHNRVIVDAMLNNVADANSNPAFNINKNASANEWWIGVSTQDEQVALQTDAAKDEYHLWANCPGGGGNVDSGIIFDVNAAQNTVFVKKLQSETVTDNSTAEDNCVYYNGVMYGANNSIAVGTFTPSGMLTLYDNTDAGVYATFQNTGNHPSGLKLKSGHGNWGIYDSNSIGDAFEIRDDSEGALRLAIMSDGGVYMYNLPADVNQADAGADANELWVDTDDDYTIKLGQ